MNASLIATKTNTLKKKKDQLSLAKYGDKLPANRPDPDDPGGLGAEESGTERTGPTQYVLVATQLGRRLSEIGPYYDSANDPVTVCFWLMRSVSGGQSRRRPSAHRFRFLGPLAAARGWSNHAR